MSALPQSTVLRARSFGFVWLCERCTQLHAGGRERRLDGLKEALQDINTDNEDVLHSAIAPFSYHLQPEFGAFVLGSPAAEDFLIAR